MDFTNKKCLVTHHCCKEVLFAGRMVDVYYHPYMLVALLDENQHLGSNDDLLYLFKSNSVTTSTRGGDGKCPVSPDKAVWGPISGDDHEHLFQYDHIRYLGGQTMRDKIGEPYRFECLTVDVDFASLDSDIHNISFAHYFTHDDEVKIKDDDVMRFDTYILDGLTGELLLQDSAKIKWDNGNIDYVSGQFTKDDHGRWAYVPIHKNMPAQQFIDTIKKS